MKVFNKHIFLITVIILIVLSACKKPEDITLNEPSHRVIFTSEMDFENKVQVNGQISFGDISAGVESRMWTFPEGAVDIIDSDNDLTSTEETLSAIFTKVGEYPIKLSQTFREDAFVGETVTSRSLDTTIIVTVLDTIRASLEAYYINSDGTTGDPVNISDLAGNEVPASKSIRYIYTGTGDPENILWKFEGGTPAEYFGSELEIDVKYKFLGTYSMEMIPSRRRPFGADTLAFEDLIAVVPSTDPVLVESIRDRDGNIAVEFSREIDPATINPIDFSLSISNDGDPIPANIDMVSLDQNEGNVILISLVGEKIYNDDSISVSFTEGTLYSLDGVIATGFTDELLEFNKVNIFANFSEFDYSFESSTPDNWLYLPWDSPWDKYSLSISNAQAQDGGSSAYIEMEEKGGMIVTHVDNDGNEITFPAIKGKTYELGVWVYVETVGDPTVGLAPDIRLYWGPDTDWSLGGNPTLDLEYPLNEWVYSSVYVEFGESGDKSLMIRGFNSSNPLPTSLYIDNLTLVEVELRP